MEEKEQPTMAELIKKYRTDMGFTQTQLCEATGISISTLKKYETGVRHPKAEQLKRIAEALGVSEQIFMPITVKDRSDILITLMQLDDEADLEWDYKYNAEGIIIPETITISFKDHELNQMLAGYVLTRDKAKDLEELVAARRMISYSAKAGEKIKKNKK